MDLFPYLFHSVEIIIPEYIRVFPNGKPGKRISQGKMRCRKREGLRRFSLEIIDTEGIRRGLCGCFKLPMGAQPKINVEEWESALLR
jgi:hypothetical protein